MTAATSGAELRARISSRRVRAGAPTSGPAGLSLVDATLAWFGSMALAINQTAGRPVVPVP